MMALAKVHGRLWRFIFTLHFYAFLGALGLVALLASAAGLAWKLPPARRFVHTEVVRYYLREVAPRLPFTIVNLDVDAHWKEFFKGWIRDFTVELRWSGRNLKLSGPIQISFDHGDSSSSGEHEKHLDATYLPKLHVQGLPEIPLTIAFRADADLSHLDSLTFHTSLDDWSWKERGIRLKNFTLGATWEQKVAHVSVTSDSVDLNDPKHGHSLRLNGLNLSTSAPLTLKPFRVGPEATVDASAKQGSTHWDEADVELPLAELPFHAKFELADTVNSVELSVGRGKNQPLQIEAALQRNLGSPPNLKLQWKTQSLSIPALIAGLRSTIPNLVSEDSPLNDVRKLSGKVSTRGTAELTLPITSETLRNARVDGSISARKIGFEWPEKNLAVSGFNADVPISSSTGVNASFAIQKILFYRFRGSLEKTELVIRPEAPEATAPRRYEMLLGDAGGKASIPLKLGSLPLRIGSLTGQLTYDPARNPKLDWDLATSLKLASTELSTFANQFCVSTEHIPPAQLIADFPKIEVTSSELDPTGSARVNLFKGSLELSQIGLYDFMSAVPEVDFDLDMRAVDLHQLGDWAGFGEMDGTLESRAHDVVFQGWLPTQYDFQFQAKPLHHPKVIFSPEAMKNLARLVASESIDHLPKLADWAAFGLPSHLLGGYDIWFVGVSLFSKGGHILLQVLEPPDLPADLPISVMTDHQQNHYILYANRFTIPLKTSYYPLVLDATSVSNYVYGQVMPKLLKLRQAKNAADKQKGKNGNEKQEMDCAPPAL